MRLGGPSKLLGLGVNSWVSGFLTPQPAVLNVQRQVVTIAVGQTTKTTSSILVHNSAYVRLRYLGVTEAGSGGADNTSKVIARISLTIVDATHVTVTATRAEADGGITVTASFEIAELNPRFVKSIQRGTMSSSAPQTITAVRVAHAELDWLGQVGPTAVDNTFGNDIVLTNSTTITATGSSFTLGWQVIEWR